MTADQFVNILATVTLLEMMFAIGLGVTVSDVVGVARNWRIVCRAILANYLLVPAVAVGLLLAFHAHPLVAAGFLIAAVCPGAPYGPPLTALTKGNVVVSVGLMVILAGSSAVLAPLLLQALLPIVAGNEPIRINAAKMVITLALTQFLPLCVGLFVRQRYPAPATRLKKPAGQLSAVLNLLLIGIILVVQFRTLAAIRLMGYVGMLALLAATVLAGWALGGTTSGNRKAMTMATSVRNVGVSLVIATTSFPGSLAVSATTAYALVQTIIMALAALIWGRHSSYQGSTLAGSFKVPSTHP
ncbi:MAG: bile acid:sodium symporter family protein [Bacillota bacterium]